jgi:hypothetical protein
MADDSGTAVDETHMFEPHVDRHVWIYRDNPNGMFAPLKPLVTCGIIAAPSTHPLAHGS